jgi:hypothetical protein
MKNGESGMLKVGQEYFESTGLTLKKSEPQQTNYDQAREIGEDAAFERFGILGEVLYVAAKDDETEQQIAACRNWRVGIAMKESRSGDYVCEEEIFLNLPY